MNELEYSLICPNLKIQKLSDLISFVFKRLKWAEQERGGSATILHTWLPVMTIPQPEERRERDV